DLLCSAGGSRKGILTFWARARRLLWSWWPWTIAATWALAHDKWGWAIGTAAMAVISYLIAPVEAPPRFGLDHEFGVDAPEFLATVAGASGTPFIAGNAVTLLNNGDRFYRAMLAAIRQAELVITVKPYIYKAGDIGREFGD